METATLTLNGSLSHTVRLPGQNEVKFLKGRSFPTSDKTLIAYAKSNPTFSVTLNVIEQPRRSADDGAERPSEPPAVSVRQASGRFTRKQPTAKPEVPND